MKHVILEVLVAATLLVPSGCVLSGASTREVTWAKMGTPARIVDKRPVAVMLPDGEGGWMPGTADLSGMVALDEPTLEHYQALDAPGGGHDE